MIKIMNKLTLKQKKKIFTDIQEWLLKNHDHFPYTDEEDDELDGEPYVLSMVFEEWLRNYLKI